MTQTSSKQHYGAIDGLRAFSAIGIIAMHVLANGNYRVQGFVFDRLIPSFTNLVFLFMVISGFAMCCGYYEKILRNEITVGAFYGKRYAKIWPFFALLCLMDVIISPSKEALYEAFANLTLCFGLLPNANLSVIGVGWFLGLVFVFYLAFPFFCYLLSDKKRAWLSFAAAMIFNILCTVYFHAERSNLLYSAVFFFAGGMIYLYRIKLARFVQAHRWLIMLACAAVVVGYYCLGASAPLMLILFSLLLIYTLGDFKGILQNPVTRFLGGISMEIYLSHMMIFRILQKLGFLHLFSSDTLSYAITTSGTTVGAIIFSLAAKKALKTATKIYTKVLERAAETKRING